MPPLHPIAFDMEPTGKGHALVRRPMSNLNALIPLIGSVSPMKWSHILWKRRLPFCSFLRSALASDISSATEGPSAIAVAMSSAICIEVWACDLVATD
jgi:hypothetical protein